MSATEAWKQCGEPRGEKCIQNIRKRARELREKRLLDVVPHRGGTPAAAATPLPLADAEGGEGGGGEREANGAGSAQRNQPAFRLRGDQVQKAAQLHQAMKADFNTVYAAATLEWQQLVTSGRSGKGENSADAVAARFNLQLPDGCTRRLSGKILRNRVNEGKAGCGPGQTGPKRTIPDAFVRGLADYAQVHQLQGNEQKPRQLVAALVASAKGTIYEENLAKASQKRTILRRMRIEMGMATVSSKVIDDRRWKWLTSTNLRNWFVGYIQTLHQWGFIPSIPDDIFEIIVIDPEKAKRMLNGDESHQKLSNEGETAGPRSKVYINPALGRAGKRKIAYQKHATILVWVTYGGEVGAPHLILATDAQAAKKSAAPDADPSTIRIRPEWTFGIPRINGTFGLPPGSEPKTFEPSFLLNEKGGMAGGGLQQFIELQLEPAYPTLSTTWTSDDAGNITGGPVFMQLDAGPDRYTDCSLQWRASIWAKGLILFPGLPNGTAANQVCDDLFGTYKADCDDRIDDILSERLLAQKQDPSVKVKLDFCDLGRVINGVDGDDISKRPFARAFSKEKIINSVERLGLNPIDARKAMAHKRVRDDSGDGCRAVEVANTYQSFSQSRDAVAALGFNSDALALPEPTTELTTPSNIAGPSDYETQWLAVKQAGGCAGAHWAAVGAKAFNAPEVVGPALERVQEKIAESQERAAKKADTFLELRERSRAILTAMDDEGDDFEDLSVADLKTLISYVFQAENKTGVGKVTTNKNACVEFLESLQDGHLLLLIDSPPASAPIAVATLAEEPLLQLTDNTETSPAAAVALLPSEFDSILHLCPDGMSIVASPPDWLRTSLQQTPTSLSPLVGKTILYKWPLSAGSWMLGKLALNTNKKQKVGDEICNYKCFYEGDQQWAYHSLSIAKYARSSSSRVDSWVLLE